MATIIKHRQVIPDNWQLLKSAGEGALAIPPEGDVIVPLNVWREQRAALLTRAGKLGVWLDGHDDPASVAADLAHFELIAVNFKQFTDGRGYSIARLLRERYGWRGELRAIGDVLRDNVFYLSRCGFDSFALRAEQNPQTALAAFGDFSNAYQAAVDRPQPLFRRRATASGASVEPA